MEIVNFQKKVFQLPRDIQTIIREYGVVQVNNYLICRQKLPGRYLSLHCKLYTAKIRNVSKKTVTKVVKHKKISMHTISAKLANNFVIDIIITPEYVSTTMVQISFSPYKSYRYTHHTSR